MNKEQEELVDGVYKNYCFTCIGETKRQEQEMKEKGGWLTLCLTPYFENKEKFINKCKTDTDFSNTWGLKIEEREFSLEERQDLYFKLNPEFRLVHENMNKQMDNFNIPTKLITIKYNNKTIESYE
jgi:hypothetical protein